MSSLFIQPNAASGFDTYIADNSPTLNFGTATNLNIGTYLISKSSFAKNRALVSFDLSQLIGSTINSVDMELELVLFSGVVGSATFTVNRCTRPWTQLGATWNKFDGVTDWTTPGGDFDGSLSDSCTVGPGDSFLQFNMLALVQDAIANRSGRLSLLIRGPESGSANSFTAHSAEYSDFDGPFVNIDFTGIMVNASDPLSLQDLAVETGRKNPFTEAFAAIPPVNLEIGQVIRDVHAFLVRLQAENPNVSCDVLDNPFDLILALDQPRIYLLAPDRRAVNVLRHLAQTYDDLRD